jgi:hypothetical protein
MTSFDCFVEPTISKSKKESKILLNDKQQTRKSAKNKIQPFNKQDSVKCS